MFIIINLILLLLATAGSIIAVGGKTWEKSKITYRGKMAIFFLALAFSVGAFKEFLVRKEKLVSFNRQTQIMSNLEDVKYNVRMLSTHDLTVDEIKSGLSLISNRLGDIGDLIISPTKNGDKTEIPILPKEVIVPEEDKIAKRPHRKSTRTTTKRKGIRERNQ